MSEWIKYFEEKRRNIFNRCLSCRRLIELIILNTPKNGRILEVGCGTGILSLILADYGFVVSATDIDTSVLNYAQERLCLKGLSLEFVKADILNLSKVFKENYFDTVFSKGLMEHFQDEDAIKGLLEQKKVARKVIFHVPNNRSKKDFGDERLLSNEEWVKLIRRAGFKNIQVYGDFDMKRCFYFFPILFYKQRFSFIWKYFSNHSIFVCE